MSSDKSSTCENSTGIIVHIVTAHTVALSPTRGRTTADCFRWELWAHDSRNISVRSSRHAQILSVMIYTCPIPDFIFPKSRVINVLKHYTRSFNTSDYLAQNHRSSSISKPLWFRVFFLCRWYCLPSSCLHISNLLFLFLPGSRKSSRFF